MPSDGGPSADRQLRLTLRGGARRLLVGLGDALCQGRHLPAQVAHPAGQLLLSRRVGGHAHSHDLRVNRRERRHRLLHLGEVALDLLSHVAIGGELLVERVGRRARRVVGLGALGCAQLAQPGLDPIRVQAVEVLVHELRAAGRALQLTDQRRDLAAQVGEGERGVLDGGADPLLLAQGRIELRADGRRQLSRVHAAARGPLAPVRAIADLLRFVLVEERLRAQHHEHDDRDHPQPPRADDHRGHADGGGHDDVDRLGQRVDGERPAQVGPRDLLPGHPGN